MVDVNSVVSVVMLTKVFIMGSLNLTCGVEWSKIESMEASFSTQFKILGSLFWQRLWKTETMDWSLGCYESCPLGVVTESCHRAGRGG